MTPTCWRTFGRRHGNSRLVLRVNENELRAYQTCFYQRYNHDKLSVLLRIMNTAHAPCALYVPVALKSLLVWRSSSVVSFLFWYYLYLSEEGELGMKISCILGNKLSSHLKICFMSRLVYQSSRTRESIHFFRKVDWIDLAPFPKHLIADWVDSFSQSAWLSRLNSSAWHDWIKSI